MSETKSVFETLYAIDVSNKVKEKNGLSYLPWVSAITEVKKIYPDSFPTVYPQIIDSYGNTRFWHDDGKSGWCDVGYTIEGHEERITLPIMDLRNKAIPADQITATEANKTMMRCLVKAIAMHGLGAFIYQGEDMPEEVSRLKELLDKVDSLAKKKAALSDRAKDKVAELCKEAERKAFPELDDSAISGNYKNIEDADILSVLEKQLMAVRK